MQVLLLAVVVMEAESSLFQVRNANHTWDYKNLPCNLATPEIRSSRNGLVADIPKDTHIGENEEVLIGYTKTLETFEYTGCIKEYDRPPNGVIHSARSAPGHCYTVCKTTYFGLSNSQCFCFSDALANKRNTHPECTTDCQFPKNTSCGGKYYISMYKHVEMTTKGSDDKRYCRSFKPETKSFFWDHCHMQKTGLCQTGANNNYTKTKNSYVWNGFVNECLTNDTYPATENSSLVHGVSGQEMWIGRIKTWVAIKIHGLSDEDNFGYFGYISLKQNAYIITFNKTRVSNLVLCLKDPETTTQTTRSTDTTTLSTITTLFETTTSTSTEDGSSGVPSNDSDHQERAENNTNSLPSNDSDHQERAENNTYSFISVAAYGSGGLAFVICAIIAILCIRRKRNQAADNAIENVKLDEVSPLAQHTQANATANASRSNDPVPNTTATQGSKNETHFNETGDIYDEADDPNHRVQKRNETKPQYKEDDTYDTTNGAKAANVTPNENIYNRLSEFAEDTYNHTDGGKVFLNDSEKLQVTGQFTDNTYSHCTTDGDMDNVYNTVDDGVHSTNKQQLDDTYSHT